MTLEGPAPGTGTAGFEEFFREGWPGAFRLAAGTWNEYTTLELTWREHDVEMRLHVYFRSDGRQWWSDEIRIYDGAKEGKWITFHGDFFRSPLGTPFAGGLDVQGTDHGVAGRLRLPGLGIEAFRRPAACLAKTAPLAVEPGVDQITLRLDESSSYGVRAILLDTATCLPVGAENGHELRWEPGDPAIVEVRRGLGTWGRTSRQERWARPRCGWSPPTPGPGWSRPRPGSR